MQRVANSRLLKLALVGALVLGVFAAGLLGNRGSRALAQERQPQTYLVHGGGFGVGNTELYGFAPSSLQVHRGDTITWHIVSFHNVHIGDQPAELVIMPEGGGAPQVNPAVFVPSLPSGSTYTGGDSNSGLPMGESLNMIYSLVIDLEPGVYTYFCDVHPGMVGTFEVVADDVQIPSPGEAAVLGSNEVAEQTGAALGDMFGEMAAMPMQPTGGVMAVNTGNGGSGRAVVLQFNPAAVVINAGESVTWTNPADSIEGHFVNSAPYDPAVLPDFVPVPQGENQPPILEAGPGFLGTTQDGAEIKSGDTFNSTFIAPGQSFTLKFTEPGAYPYTCHIHPGMNGIVFVQPAM